MTGVFPDAVVAALKTVSGTSGPATENDISSSAATTTATGAGGEYTVPYAMQSGEIRYAPMPPMAQTKISAKNASPQYSTSSYSVYVSVAGSPNAATTITASVTFSASSIENTVSYLRVPPCTRC